MGISSPPLFGSLTARSLSLAEGTGFLCFRAGSSRWLRVDVVVGQPVGGRVFPIETNSLYVVWDG